jgi:hypothetical protein
MPASPMPASPMPASRPKRGNGRYPVAACGVERLARTAR